MLSYVTTNKSGNVYIHVLNTVFVILHTSEYLILIYYRKESTAAKQITLHRP